MKAKSPRNRKPGYRWKPGAIMTLHEYKLELMWRGNCSDVYIEFGEYAEAKGITEGTVDDWDRHLKVFCGDDVIIDEIVYNVDLSYKIPSRVAETHTPRINRKLNEYWSKCFNPLLSWARGCASHWQHGDATTPVTVKVAITSSGHKYLKAVTVNGKTLEV